MPRTGARQFQRGQSRDGMRYSQTATATPMMAMAAFSHDGLTTKTIDVPSVSDISTIAANLVL